VALAAIDAQRDTFKDEDSVRIHPIITEGGELVNIVPAEVVLETYVRAKTIEAIREANGKLDRALKAGATALGAEVVVIDHPGYLPSHGDERLARLFLDNMGQLTGEENARLVGEHGGGSSDFGDLSHLMPVVQASVSGAKGRGHSPDYEIVDPQMAYIQPAKALAMTIVDLLYGGAQEASELLADFQAPLSKEEYLKLMRGFVREQHCSFQTG
jgi:metal-dependent amidase/aminoacylase/carboxypeptidase family protein